MSHRRQLIKRAALAVSLFVFAQASAAAASEEIIVVLDQAKVLQLPAGTATVVVGNPIIADITMLKKTNQVILTGKGFGQTNMIALDSRGRSVGESTVRVTTSQTGLLVQRGMERETWDCTPNCHPTVRLGDAPRFLTESAGQIAARNGASQPNR